MAKINSKLTIWAGALTRAASADSEHRMRKGRPALVQRLDPEESFGYVMNRLARDYVQAIGREVGKLGLQPAYVPVLLSLWDGEGKSQAELAAMAEIEPPTMGATLARMQRDGLITKALDPNDRRVSRIMLTERARGLREQVGQIAAEVNRTSTSTLTAAAPAELMLALRQISEALRTPMRDEDALPRPAARS